MQKTEMRERLMGGPVGTLSPSFLKNGDIDYKGVARTLDAMIQAGSPAILLTAGDSHYVVLSDKEIGELTKFVAGHVKGRVLLVAADRYFSTAQALAFTRHTKALGYDIQMLMPPDWGGSCTPETMAAHYVTVSALHPVMIVTNVFVARGAAFGLRTVELALEKSRNIVSVKDDFCGVFARQLMNLAAERVAVLAGGQKQNHMNMLPYGPCGYLSTLIKFKPEIAWNYWNACRAGDLGTASGIIKTVDMPFFDLIQKCRGGFDAGIHGAMELTGLGKRWRPKPYVSLTDEEMAALHDGLRGLGVC